MADSKSEIGEPVTARNAPAIVKAAGRSTEFAWEEGYCPDCCKNIL